MGLSRSGAGHRLAPLLSGRQARRVQGDLPQGRLARSRAVLVLGDDMRSFLTTVRSLGRRGIEVDVAPVNLGSPSLRSRYIRHIHRLSPYTGDGRQWVEELRELVALYRYDLVLPCDDRSILPFHDHRGCLDTVRIAIPDAAAVDVLFDKRRTRELAAALGIPLAKTAGASPAELQQAFERLGRPVVVKPSQSCDLAKPHRRLTVRIVETEAGLDRAVAELGSDRCYLEQFFSGFGVGVSVLAQAGDLLLVFQHHRIHERPPSGASSYRVSVTPSSDLLDACQRMTRALNFTGLAMFEFRRNPADGAWILLEVNARPWGSMPLPVALGVDFPYALYRLLVEGERPETTSYRPGIYGRNLGLDLDFIGAAIEGARSTRARGALALRWFAGFSRLLIGRERLDATTLDDPVPGLVELRAFGGRVVRRALRHSKAAARVRGAVVARRVEASLRRAARRGGPATILFVCSGNICRSPFAERLLARRLPSGSPIAVGSAGTLPERARISPPEAVAAARRWSIDLAGHRSRPVEPGDVASAALLIVFDSANRDAMRLRFGRVPAPIVRLGELVPRLARAGDIADPFGGTEEVFRRTYELVASSMDEVVRCIERALR